MKDSNWMSKNVYTDSRYISFRSGKVKDAFDILEKE
jgi:hypothetical protein